MDSKLIYIAGRAIERKISWISTTADSEWTYFGEGNEVNGNIVHESINRHFAGNSLYVCYTRQQSFAADKSHIMDSIKELLGKAHFSVWDDKFTKVIEFSKIGVMRKGETGSLLPVSKHQGKFT